jgi:hypothetical protein
MPESVPRTATPEAFDGLVTTEAQMRDRFERMNNSELARSGALIFLTILGEDAPRHTSPQIELHRKILETILNGELPDQVFDAAFLAPKSVVGWVEFLRVYIERVQEINTGKMSISTHVEVVEVEPDESDDQTTE